MATERILVIDDEPGVREALEGVLSDDGFRVATAESGEAGLELLGQQSFDAILLDVWLPGIDGLETLTAIRERRTDAEVVMISGHGTIETAVRATKLGAFDFVEKPLSLDRTLLVLRNALRQRRLERANRRLVQQLRRDTEILGDSPATRELRRAVERASEQVSPVLIVGPGGSGRENVARNIHQASERATKSFVEIPLGALSADTAPRALFGEGSQSGRVELAAKGTLFLEDVDRLDEGIQRDLAARLIVTLRDAESAPRVIASAGNTTGIVTELLQVLDVMRIDVPPLRQRREDIPRLAERFMSDLAQEYGRSKRGLTQDALAALQRYNWPGEVRELRNLIERLLLGLEGDQVRLADLPEELGGRGMEERGIDLYGSFASLEVGQQAFARYHAARALRECKGDLDKTATQLGVELKALQQLLEPQESAS